MVFTCASQLKSLDTVTPSSLKASTRSITPDCIVRYDWVRQMCARVSRDETVCATLRNTGRKLGFWMGKFSTLTHRPPRKSIPTEWPKHAIWHKKTVSTLLKMWSLKADKKSYLKKLKNNPNWPSHFTPFYHFCHVVSYRQRNHPCEILSRLINGLVRGYGSPKSRVSHGLWLLLLHHYYAVTCYCDANCLGLCRPTVFRRNVFFEMTVVAQSSVAQKINRPNVFRPTGFSPNRLHPSYTQ